jgi:hypothetical protein
MQNKYETQLGYAKKGEVQVNVKVAAGPTG